MIKYNEAQSIKNTYEHIYKRLNEERVSFDNQLSALERTLYSKKRDHEELLLLLSDACHAREVAYQELQRSKILYEESRSQRDLKIRERHQIVKVRKQLLERQERRENKRKELFADHNLEGTVDIEGDETPRPSTAFTEDIGPMSSIHEEDENRLYIYESAFRKIKEATGVSDVNEVIKKIIRQESTTENLTSLTKQNQERIENLFTMTEQMKKSVEETKYSISNNGQYKKMAEEKDKQNIER